MSIFKNEGLRMYSNENSHTLIVEMENGTTTLEPFFKKLKTNLPYYLNIYLREMKAHLHIKIHI